MRDPAMSARISNSLHDRLTDHADSVDKSVPTVVRSALYLVTESDQLTLTRGGDAPTGGRDGTRIDVRIPEDLLTAVDDHADEVGVSRSAMIRWAVLVAVDDDRVGLAKEAQ